jgi:predicted peptidase
MKKCSLNFLFAFFVFSFIILIPVNVMSQQEGMYFKVEVKKNVFLETHFLLYLPQGYDKNSKQEWPLLLFLHGMGGKGTWELAYAYPERFTAIVPICSRTDPAKASSIKDLPVWVFHGEKDDVIPPEESVNMVNTLKALGSPIRFTLYPDADHDSWTETYENDAVWEWLGEKCH